MGEDGREEAIPEGSTSVSDSEEEEEGVDDANFGFLPDAVARFMQGYDNNEKTARKAMRTTFVSGACFIIIIIIVIIIIITIIFIVKIIIRNIIFSFTITIIIIVNVCPMASLWLPCANGECCCPCAACHASWLTRRACIGAAGVAGTDQGQQHPGAGLAALQDVQGASMLFLPASECTMHTALPLIACTPTRTLLSYRPIHISMFLYFIFLAVFRDI